MVSAYQVPGYHKDAMSRKQLHALWSLAATVLALIIWMTQPKPVPPTQASSTEPEPTTTATSTSAAATSTVQTNAFVVRAVDGDTIDVKLDGDANAYKVRLLGVNTPESVDPRRGVECFGKEASHFTASLVDGKRVRLEADPLADEVDKYGRLLRNVLLEDGTDFNAKLVQDGFAYAYVSFPQNPKRKTQLKNFQAEAQAAQRGLWNPKTCDGKK